MPDVLPIMLALAKRFRLLEQRLSQQSQLPLAQIRLLLAMNTDFVNLHALNQELGLDPSTLSRQLTGLTKAGLVCTQSPADKRQRDYALTADGLASKQHLHQQLEQWEQTLIANWDPEERQLLTTLLNRFVTSTDKLDLLPTE